MEDGGPTAMVSLENIEQAIYAWNPDATIHAYDELGGLLHETYSVSLSGCDVVCSFWGTEQSLKRFRKEVEMTAYLDETEEIPTPSIYYTDTTLDTIEYWYYITELVEGGPLGDVLRSPPDTELEQLIRQVGLIAGRIHSLGQFEEAGELHVGDELTVSGGNSWQRYINDKYGNRIKELSQSRFSDLERAAHEHLETILEEVETRPLTVLHGDYTPANILVNDGQIQAVIDFEQAISGRPEFELASTELHLMDQADLFPNPSITEEQRRRDLRELFRDEYQTQIALETGWEQRITAYKFLTVIGVMATFEWRAEQHDTSKAEREAQEQQLRESFHNFSTGFK